MSHRAELNIRNRMLCKSCGGKFDKWDMFKRGICFKCFAKAMLKK